MKNNSNITILLNAIITVIFVFVILLGLKAVNQSQSIYDLATRSAYFSRLTLKASAGLLRSSAEISKNIKSNKESSFYLSEDYFLASYSNIRILTSQEFLQKSEISSEFLIKDFEEIQIDFEEFFDSNNSNYLNKVFAKNILLKLEKLSAKILEQESHLWMQETKKLSSFIDHFNLNPFIFIGFITLFLITQIILIIAHFSKERLRHKIEEQSIQLIKQTRLSTLGLMSAELAHEINSPLMVIDGRLKLINQSLDDKEVNIEKLKSNLTIVERNSKRIQSIIKGLKIMSSDGHNDKMELVKLNEVFKEVSEIVSAKAKSLRVSIIFESANSNIQIFANKVQLVQVITNLVSNSIFEVKDHNERWVKINSIVSGNNLQISITDSGKGIPEDVREKMFNTFFTTKDSSSGTGLGLSISKKIINEHKGEIYYNSESENTQFIITLPFK